MSARRRFWVRTREISERSGRASCDGDARRDDAERILLDVSQVGFGDSTFLHALGEGRREPAGLILVGPLPSQIRRLFEITGTLRLFPLATDRGASGFV